MRGCVHGHIASPSSSRWVICCLPFLWLMGRWGQLASVSIIKHLVRGFRARTPRHKQHKTLHPKESRSGVSRNRSRHHFQRKKSLQLLHREKLMVYTDRGVLKVGNASGHNRCGHSPRLSAGAMEATPPLHAFRSVPSATHSHCSPRPYFLPAHGYIALWDHPQVMLSPIQQETPLQH